MEHLNILVDFYKALQSGDIKGYSESMYECGTTCYECSFFTSCNVLADLGDGLQPPISDLTNNNDEAFAKYIYHYTTNPDYSFTNLQTNHPELFI